MTDITPKSGTWVFDYEFGKKWLYRVAHNPDPKYSSAIMKSSPDSGDAFFAPLDSIVPFALIEAWLYAHECEDDEYEGSGTKEQQAYRHLSVNGDGTCACCGVDFTE